MNVVEDLITSVNITVPMVLVLAVGYFLGRIGFINDSFIKTANKLNFRVFLPCSVFASLYCNSVPFDEGMKVLIAECILIIAIFIISMLVARASTKDPSQRGTVVAGLLRSNYVYIGQPVICAICGITSSPISSIVLAAIAIVANILTPLGFTLNNGRKFDFKTLLKDTFLSPYIIASIIGITLMLLKCPQFPPFIHKSITSLASICTPLALVALGASFDFGTLKGNRKLLTISSVLKLLVFPLIGIPLLLMAGFRGESFAALYVFLACPTATLVYSFSQEMDGDTELASQLVVVETVLSMATFFVGTFVLKTLGYM